MRPGLRVRQAVNLANGSTLAGLGAAVVGGARLARSVDGLVTATGYRLPVPPAPAFCLGNVILIRGDDIDPATPLFRHEARHATQYAWSGGVAMVPLYLMAAGASWALTGDFGARNIFERLAGLADGGLITRTVCDGPPVTVIYQLTERGRALMPALDQIAKWARDNLPPDG